MSRSLRLKKNLDRAIAQGHPWLWSDAIDGFANPGEVVDVVDSRGRVLATGIADESPIGVRIFSTTGESVNASLFERRIEAAAQLRDFVVPPNTNAYRLLHGEGDRLPGFVCDVYGAYAVARLDSAGAESWFDVFVDAMRPVLAKRGVTSLLVRTGKRGNTSTRVAFGHMPEGLVDVLEHGMVLPADLESGQKTGLFLDHRESRKRVRELSSGHRVLNLYGYTGGFSIAAGLGGAAHVTTVDIAPRAIELSELGFEKNGLPANSHRAIASDVPEYLKAAKAAGERFEIIVCDPPSFAPSEDAVPSAMQSYQKLHEACLELLVPGGLYLAASCSSHIGPERFDATLMAARAKRGAVLQILERTGGAADHPRLLAFPEGDYLKVRLTRSIT